MVVESRSIHLNTRHEGEIVDITGRIQSLVEEGKARDGIALVFVPGSTGALTTIEFEPGLLSDLPALLERLAPSSLEYQHEKRWHDGNGHSHIRASLIGPSLTVPFQDRKLQLGTWQQIVFLELDVRARERTILVQLMGE